jgi:membrane associated rhomboid family serine protease
MDRLLARLDRRFGRFALENLPMFIVGGMGIVFLLAYTRPSLLLLLSLDPRLVAHGQVWRLVTYLFIPPDMSVWWILFTLYWVWMIGSNLEAEWGAFKLNVYYFLGMLGTTAAALITGGPQGNMYLNLSLLFAFATLFPEYEILLFLILPIRMKWLGWISFAFVGYELAIGDWGVRGAIAAALSNYLLFFWGDILRVFRGGRAQARQAARRGSSIPPPPLASQSRACAMCGAREADGADIRVCSCEKCKAATGGTARTLCLEHARNH